MNKLLIVFLIVFLSSNLMFCDNNSLKDMITNRIISNFLDKLNDEYNNFEIKDYNFDFAKFRNEMNINSNCIHSKISKLMKEKNEKIYEFTGLSIYKYFSYNYYLKNKYLSQYLSKIKNSEGKANVYLIKTILDYKNNNKYELLKDIKKAKNLYYFNKYQKSIITTFLFILNKVSINKVISITSGKIKNYFMLLKLYNFFDRKILMKLKDYKFEDDFQTIYDGIYLLNSENFETSRLTNVLNHGKYLLYSQKIRLLKFFMSNKFNFLCSNSISSNFDLKNNELSILNNINMYKAKNVVNAGDINFLVNYYKKIAQKNLNKSILSDCAFEIAEILFKNCKFNNAVFFYRKTSGPKRKLALLKSVIIYLNLGKKTEAKKIFKEAKKIKESFYNTSNFEAIIRNYKL